MFHVAQVSCRFVWCPGWSARLLLWGGKYSKLTQFQPKWRPSKWPMCFCKGDSGAIGSCFHMVSEFPWLPLDIVQVPRGKLWMTGANLSIQPKMTIDFRIGTHEKCRHKSILLTFVKSYGSRVENQACIIWIHMVCFHRVSLKTLWKVTWSNHLKRHTRPHLNVCRRSVVNKPLADSIVLQPWIQRHPLAWPGQHAVVAGLRTVVVLGDCTKPWI